MPLTDLDQQWIAATELANRVGAQDFELLGRLRTQLEDLAGPAGGGAGDSHARAALRALDQVILRDSPFEEGIAEVRRALAARAAEPATTRDERPAAPWDPPAEGPPAQPTGTTAPAAAGAGLQCLVIGLADELHGLDVLSVREILGLTAITPVPGAPDCLRGVINLRGRVIPVVDLRARFGLPRVAATAETCIVIVTVRDELIGLIVDRVCDVTRIPQADIDPAPPLGPQVAPAFVTGLARSGGRVVILLDAERLLTDGGLFRAGEPAA